MSTLTVSVEDFARSFGTTLDDISIECRDLIARIDFTYRVIEGLERDQLILTILKRIDADQQKIAADERQEIWNKGWAENLQSFVDSGFNLDSLTPKFIRPGQPIRFNGRFIMPTNPNFERDYFIVFRTWLFRKYFADVESIYDFGCGSGFNLIALAQMYPKKKLHGLDFVPSSRDLINKIAETYGWNMHGHLFNMVTPDEILRLDTGAAAFTSGSIEQLASRFEAFLQFILMNKPALCIHIEPTIELYNASNLLDYLAIKFHTKRGYSQGLLPRLQVLTAQKKIELLKAKRLFFGSLFMEGFTLIIWRPRAR